MPRKSGTVASASRALPKTLQCIRYFKLFEIMHLYSLNTDARVEINYNVCSFNVLEIYIFLVAERGLRRAQTTKFSLACSLVALLARMYDEQAFPSKFSLTSFVFSCVRLNKFYAPEYTTKFPLTSFICSCVQQFFLDNFLRSKSGMTSF